MTAAVSWSGGKDCCLLAMFDETGERTRSHAIPRAVMQAQADALGLELMAPSAGWADYEPTFIDALKDLRARGVADVVFGDIDLAPHREWEEKVCASAGVTPHLPLWQEDRRALAAEVLDLGYHALVVCTDDRWLGPSFCGRLYDRAFIQGLPESVDVCGENGEFHTFVSDGPPFRSPVRTDITAVDSRIITFGQQSYTYHFARLALARVIA
jgi:diphthine-ammonia ligase